MNYILDGQEPVAEPDVIKWAKWFGGADRQVALDIVDGRRVSTVFLGIDHNFRSSGPPVLFETMIFGPDEGGCWRYATWAEAAAGHAAVVAALRDGTPLP